MIPKIIHYCWFGRGAMPDLAYKCIESWKKYFPDYEIKEWNEDNFDVNAIPYTKEAYASKKYAFVSDYARFWILYQYGGVYFDTDVEVIKPFTHIIDKGAFMGFENNEPNTTGVAPGLGLGVEVGHPLYKEIKEYYEKEHFLNDDGSMNLRTVVSRVTGILEKSGLIVENRFQMIGGINIYPYDYFCPIRVSDGQLCLTDNTVTIHHYASSWVSPAHLVLRKVILAVGGRRFKNFLSRLKNNS